MIQGTSSFHTPQFANPKHAWLYGVYRLLTVDLGFISTAKAKWRVCPLWKETLALLKQLVAEQKGTAPYTGRFPMKAIRAASEQRAHLI